MKHEKLKFLNVVDYRRTTGSPGVRRTIMYNGRLWPFFKGFIYTFEYRTGKGSSIHGAGVVENEEYADMSPEEIELVCTVGDPPTPEDVYSACVYGDMTKALAKRYAGLGLKAGRAR